MQLRVLCKLPLEAINRFLEVLTLSGSFSLQVGILLKAQGLVPTVLMIEKLDLLLEKLWLLDVGDHGLDVMLDSLQEELSIALAVALLEDLLLQPVLLELEIGNTEVQSGVGLVVPEKQQKGEDCRSM
jgi:hypothetical protein